MEGHTDDRDTPVGGWSIGDGVKVLKYLIKKGKMKGLLVHPLIPAQ